MTRSFLLCLAFTIGCGSDLSSDPAAPQENKVFGKTTTDIKKFDPNAKNQKVSDGSFTYSDPYTGPLNAYGPALERSFLPLVNGHYIRAFHAIEGRYPKDYDEFMEKVVKANNLKLPVLPGSKKWVYDEKAHELKVVEDRSRPKDD